MSEHDLPKTSCANQSSVPRNADTPRLRLQLKRSWRTVETAGWHAAGLIIGGAGQRLANSASRLDQDCRREYAGKVGMQCAAGISEVSTVVVVVREIPLVGGVVMLMVVVRESRVRNRLRIGARRRHDARELRDHE
jgi:hypothetical protein